MGMARFEIYPELLDIINRDKKYQIFQGINPLLTPNGKEFVHESERLMQLIVTDLIFHGAEKEAKYLSPILYAFQKDIIEQGSDPFRLDWDGLLKSDPFVLIKTTGTNDLHPFTPDDKLFSFSFITLSGLIRSINDFVNSTLGEIDLRDSDSHPFPELLLMCYDRLTSDKKVVVQALSGLHNSSLVLPLVLVSGIISPNEYVKGLIATKIQSYAHYDSLLLDVTMAMEYLEDNQPGAEAIRQVITFIREGENENVEFKSTLRWDIRAGKTNQAIERACLKTISAFLNSRGGTLLIGVRDDGSIEGIESDKFVNEDKFLLHLWTLIRSCLGRDVSRYIRTRLEKTDEKNICIVQCLQSNRPVFLRQPGFDEEFFIRIGPSSNAMDISEALKYIADHFPVT